MATCRLAHCETAAVRPTGRNTLCVQLVWGESSEYQVGPCPDVLVSARSRACDDVTDASVQRAAGTEVRR